MAKRDVPPEPVPTDVFPPLGDLMADLDGDGRDELVVWYNRRMFAWDRQLKEIWSRPAGNWNLGRFLPGQPGRPRTIIVNLMTAIDGSTARPTWAYATPQRLALSLLDPGDAGRQPRILVAKPGATICREPLATTESGAYAPPSGSRVPADLAVDDPRWTRPLPWTAPVGKVVSPSWFCALVGLALVNVVLPTFLLRLAARRRPWTLRLLMMLPIAATIPLSSYLGFEPLLPAKVDPLPPNPRLLFALATLAGLPVLALLWSVLAAVVRLRWRSIAVLAVLTVASSLAIAAIWIWRDRARMPPVEHYGSTAWPLILVPGAYAAGVLILLGWTLRRPYRWLMRPRRPATATP